MEASLWATYQTVDAAQTAIPAATTIAAAITDAAVTMDAATAETIVSGGLSFFYSSAEDAAETMVPGVPIITAVVTIIITAAVLLSGSFYYSASAETEISSNIKIPFRKILCRGDFFSYSNKYETGNRSGIFIP